MRVRGWMTGSAAARLARRHGANRFIAFLKPLLGHAAGRTSATACKASSPLMPRRRTVQRRNGRSAALAGHTVQQRAPLVAQLLYLQALARAARSLASSSMSGSTGSTSTTPVGVPAANATSWANP
jgi:hypothetical protein